jgi:hypothetical protein
VSSRIRRLAAGRITVLAAGLSGALMLFAAQAGAAVSDGMPNQAQTDLSATDSANGSGQAGWADMAGGTAARPYVQSLTVINGGVPTRVVQNGTTTPASVPDGTVTTVVAPFNLCRPGQPPAQGSCYSTPNRVGLTVTYAMNGQAGYNFATPQVPVSPTVDANTIIDMTVALNTLGKSLRWTWANGDLLYWQTSNLGQDNATVRIKFKPAFSPYIATWSDNFGCTATPIRDCSIQAADAEMLTASMVFSLDDSLDPALTGAVFATQNAIAGFLEPGGTAAVPTLEMQVASTHTKSNGTPQLGTLKALIPAAALLNLYGVLPADATTAFRTTRTGDAGTNSAPTYEQWSAAREGSDGLFVTIENITFSAPAYKVAGKLKPVKVKAKAKGGKTTVTAKASKCSKKNRCVASLYNLGKGESKLYKATKTTILKNKSVNAKKLSLSVRTSKLKKGSRVLLVLHSAKKKTLLVSSVAKVR